MRQEALEAGAKVSNAGFSNPGNSNVEVVPVWGNARTRVLQVTIELGTKPDLKGLIVEHGSDPTSQPSASGMLHRLHCYQMEQPLPYRP